ncbi:MAG: hypothetical protein P4N59_05580 [Negativicutes bacterium]|nr:hypothetical protein [Negativicutes bacterium]
MNHHPSRASDIYVEWVTTEGGIGVSAFLEANGQFVIGIYPLSHIGHPSGLPSWFRQNRLVSDVTVGYRDQKPLVIPVDIEVTARGISLIVAVPFMDTAFPRFLSAQWGSKPPRYFRTCPVNSNWPVMPSPREAI